MESQEALTLLLSKSRTFSKELQVPVQKLTLIRKSLINGVPTAHDLIKPIGDSSATLSNEG